MKATTLEKAARPKALGGYLKKQASAADKDHGAHGTHGGALRTAEHNGHHIELETTYRVRIDGKPVKLELMVDDAGVVHCHALPNYQFVSALDMVRAVIDLFPDEFAGHSTRPGGKGSKGGHVHKPARTSRKRGGKAK